MKYSLLLSFLLAAASFCPNPAQATTVLELEAEPMTELSAFVFVGEVLSVNASVDPEVQRVWTDITFHIEEMWKAPQGEMLPEIFTLRQLGGVTPELTQTIIGYPKFEVSERVVLFLEKTSTQTLVVTGLSQGKYTISQSHGSEVLATREVGDLHFINRPAERYLSNVPAHLNKLPLAQLKSLVKDGLAKAPAFRAKELTVEQKPELETPHIRRIPSRAALKEGSR